MDDQHPKTPEMDKNQDGSNKSSRNRSTEYAGGTDAPSTMTSAAALSTAASDVVEGATSMVNDLANNETVNRATTMVRNVGEQALAAASNAGSTAQELAKQARDQVSGMVTSSTRAGEYLTRNVNEYPLTALLIAGAVGYGIAYLLHNSWQSADPKPARSTAASRNSDKR